MKKEKIVMMNGGAKEHIKEINDELFDFFNQPYMAFIPHKRKQQFKSIMEKLVQLEPIPPDFVVDKTEPKPKQLEFPFPELRANV